MKKIFNVSTIAKIGVLSAIAVIVMLFEIPLWFAPSFYEIDLSEVIVLIGGFALGPVAAIFIELIKIVLNFLINGTVTAGIGEFANFVMGLSFVLPAVYIYRHKKSMKTAVIGMSVGTVSLAIVGGLANLYLLLPLYAQIYGIPIDVLVDMGSKINGSITNVYTFVMLATTPFNILKGVLSSVVTLLLYKRLSSILHK
ncbi:MAG: ECF transporter S component [Oscillospiraceae bacterium]